MLSIRLHWHAMWLWIHYMNSRFVVVIFHVTSMMVEDWVYRLLRHRNRVREVVDVVMDDHSYRFHIRNVDKNSSGDSYYSTHYHRDDYRKNQLENWKDYQDDYVDQLINHWCYHYDSYQDRNWKKILSQRVLEMQYYQRLRWVDLRDRALRIICWINHPHYPQLNGDHSVDVLFVHATSNSIDSSSQTQKILTWTDADVGNVRICVTETSSRTCPPFCIVAGLVFGGCVPRISPSSRDSGSTVNVGWVSMDIKHADRITGWSWQRSMWHMGHESRISVAQRTRFFFDRIIPNLNSEIYKHLSRINWFLTF